MRVRAAGVSQKTSPGSSRISRSSRPFPVQAKSGSKTSPEQETFDHEWQTGRSPGPSLSFGDMPVFPGDTMRKDDRSGLPKELKTGIEDLSGVSLDNVNVHYNSPEPAKLEALAYTWGTDIHVGPGQENHLAHEAWHVVQQSQGRLKQTTRAKGVAINDEAVLEREAEEMGNRAASRPSERSNRQGFTYRPAASSLQDVENAGSHPADSGTAKAGIVQRYSFTPEEMERFHQNQIGERQSELQGLNRGFVMRGAYQPGPVVRGAQGLLRSRFDLSEVGEEHRDSVEHALSMGTGSPSQNQVVAGVGSDLFGRMLRNVGRLKQDNFVRDLANASGSQYYTPFKHEWNPNKAINAESAKLKVGVNRAVSPHYSHEDNSISLMNPDQMDQTGHELQHARDQLHGDLDLGNPSHRLASELNAFTRQDSVARETTGASPQNFTGRTPQQMAESYHGKAGYPGTLTQSLAEVERWHDEDRRPQ